MFFGRISQRVVVCISHASRASSNAEKLDYGLKTTASIRSRTAFEHFNFSEHTVPGFLKATTYAFAKETVAMYGFSGSATGENVEIVSNYFTRKGLCHTIKPIVNSNIFSIEGGYYLYLYHNAQVRQLDDYGRSVAGFELYIHQEHDILLPEFSSSDEENNSYMDNFYVENSEDLIITLTLHQYNKISSPDEPCESKHGYSKSKCLEKCVHNQIVERVGCTLPWLRQLDSHYPDCDEHNSVQRLISGFNTGNSSRFLKKCECPIACNMTLYVSKIHSRKEADPDVMGSTLNIYFSSNLITTMSQVVGYDWNAFLADLGASLGFLLGLSVIGIIAVIEEQIQFFIKRRKKNQVVRDMTKNANSEIVTWKTDDSAEGKSLKSIMEFLSDCDYYESQNSDKNDKKNEEATRNPSNFVISSVSQD